MKEKKYNCSMCENRHVCRDLGMGEQPDGPDCPDYIYDQSRMYRIESEVWENMNNPKI